MRIGFPGRGLGELFAPQAVARIKAAGGRVLTRTAVRGFSGEGGAADGVVLADGTRVTARWCEAAVPPQDLGALLPAAWAGAHAAFRDAADFRPSPYVSTYLWFARKLSRERFWARVWSPDDLNTDFYDLSNLRIGWEDRPSLIAANAIYSHRADGLSDEEVIAATLRELADFLPAAARERPVHARVHRVAMAKHASHPGTERKRPPTATPIRGLFLAGDGCTPTCRRRWKVPCARDGWRRKRSAPRPGGHGGSPCGCARPTDGIAGLVQRLAPLKRARRAD